MATLGNIKLTKPEELAIRWYWFLVGEYKISGVPPVTDEEKRELEKAHSFKFKNERLTVYFELTCSATRHIIKRKLTFNK